MRTSLRLTNDRNSSNKRRTDCGKQGVLQECILKSALWERLPEVLIDEILAKLPFSSLVRFCSVCQRWRDLILFSETFPRRISQLYCFFAFPKRDSKNLEMFSSTSVTSETISLQLLHKQFTLINVVASSDGVLCFDTLVHGEFVVYNPLTQRHKKLQMPACLLPGESGRWSWLAGMVVDLHTGHFKLMVARFFPSYGKQTSVYNSFTDTWKQVAPIPELGLVDSFLIILPKRFQATECGGNLFFYVNRYPAGDALLQFDFEHEAWRWIHTPGYERLSRDDQAARNGFVNGRMRDYFLLDCPEFSCPKSISLREWYQNVYPNSTWTAKFRRDELNPFRYTDKWLFRPSTLLLK